MGAVKTLVHTWLTLDFFGDARRRGGASSTLTTTIFTQSFLALIVAALLYPETPPIPFAAANLSLSSLLVAIGLLGDEDRIGRRRANQVLLGTSPVRARDVVMARTGHAAFYICLITTGMALPPAILLGCLLGSAGQAIGYIVLACACSGLAAGALAVTMRLATRLLGHARAALLGGTIKALLLGGGLALFALGLQQLRGTASDLPIGRQGAELLPTYQAARLLNDPLGELWRLGALLGAGLVLLTLAVLLGEREVERAATARHGSPLRRGLRWLAGKGPRLGLAEFVATAMWRSPGFRARVLPLLGLPAGMVYLMLHDGGQDHAFVFVCVLLQLPAIYLPFLIAFLPRADQENTGWVFDQAPPVALELVRDATWRALVTHVLVPVHALAALILVPLSGAMVETATASLFSLALATLAARPMCGALPSIPFSDDAAGEPATDLGSLFPFALALLAVAITYGAFLTPAMRYAVTVGATALSIWTLCRRPATTEGAPAATTSRPAPPAAEAQASSNEHLPAAEQLPDGGLRRELRAIALLYVAVSIVPFLLGGAFGSAP